MVRGECKMFFWVDARSSAEYKEFNDVVTFDTTYLLNKYKMSFTPFVGANHHRHSILLSVHCYLTRMWRHLSGLFMHG